MVINYINYDGKARSITIDEVKHTCRQGLCWEVLQSDEEDQDSLTIKIAFFSDFDALICIDDEGFTITNDENVYKLATFSQACEFHEDPDANITLQVMGDNIEDWRKIIHERVKIIKPY